MLFCRQRYIFICFDYFLIPPSPPLLAPLFKNILQMDGASAYNYSYIFKYIIIGKHHLSCTWLFVVVERKRGEKKGVKRNRFSIVCQWAIPHTTCKCSKLDTDPARSLLYYWRLLSVCFCWCPRRAVDTQPIRRARMKVDVVLNTWYKCFQVENKNHSMYGLCSPITIHFVGVNGWKMHTLLCCLVYRDRSVR